MLCYSTTVYVHGTVHLLDNEAEIASTCATHDAIHTCIIIISESSQYVSFTKAAFIFLSSHNKFQGVYF